ncbi:MAG TPA: DNA starvation/stationary phase protection protein Dps [Bryobacteraceae bacterium]|nr:DNA starvation/stationary phase protection protein Dps [Bryobacteraceae bacterium]
MPPTITGPVFQTHIDLAADARQRLTEILNRQLAATLDLYTQTKQAHWNVKGKDFFQLHELFDQLAGHVFGFIDMIAERATALGGYAQGTARMSAASSYLPEFPKDAIEGRQHLDALIERFARYTAENRKALDAAQNDDDQATADLFTEIARSVDKDLWFLEAHLQSATHKAG